MSDTSKLVRGIDLQAGGCTAYGSPFSAALLTAMARDVEAGGPTARLFAPWAAASTRALIEGAVPLRLLGGLHDLALSGAAPDLTAAYPGPHSAGDADAAWTAALEAMVAHEARLAEFMTHEPQTNEVRRSACLLPGFLELARLTGLPLRCFEIGASAGLNQLWDRYRYDYGSAGAWGDAASPVVIDSEWRGAARPEDLDVVVRERAACDRKPVDITQPALRQRLRAYVWADQPDRLARLDGAIAMALAARTVVEQMDAGPWVEARVSPADGAATVVYHSVFWQYMPAESQASTAAIIAAKGAQASPTAPFAWLRMEPDPKDLTTMSLILTLWPGGEERRLAIVHPHGAWVEWL